MDDRELIATIREALAKPKSEVCVLAGPPQSKRVLLALCDALERHLETSDTAKAQATEGR